MALAGQYFRRKANSFREISSNFRKCRKKQIAKAVAAEFACSAEAMPKESRQQSGIFRKRICGENVTGATSATRRANDQTPARRDGNNRDKLSIQFPKSRLIHRNFKPASRAKAGAPPRDR